MTSRELVNRTLEFRNPERVPRQLWALPWASIHHGASLAAIRRDFPDDLIAAEGGTLTQPPTQGDMYEVGESTDRWGARFVNIQCGVIGEVKEPLIAGDDWEDADKARIPNELLAIDTASINRQCSKTERFVMANACPRPFEQLQFLRGTENLLVDLAYRTTGMLSFIEKMHEFYCRLIETWAQTDIDGIQFMDDWGSQRSLLIDPKTWVDIFKPLYRDYIAIARKYGKKTFMHSDGYTLQIIPHLIDIGLDAFNTQIFCMGIENLSQFKGRITFWGEVDRQHLLAHASPEQVKAAVREVRSTLWADGGCIAQCEFSIGGKPENVRAVFEAWDESNA